MAEGLALARECFWFAGFGERMVGRLERQNASGDEIV